MTKGMMKRLHRIQRRQTEAGFTLIELLVVIIILGILAAVVVFAVQGTGDRGKEASVLTDARTIRTAEEAYCAQNGKYATGQELILAGLLTDLPQYHAVGAQKTGGPCNGWTFSLLRTKAAGVNPGTWEAANAVPIPPGSGSEASTWTLIRIPDGNVLDFYHTFTPSLRLNVAKWNWVNGTWTSLDPAPFVPYDQDRNRQLVLSDNSATPVNECGSNCGKILFHLVVPCTATCERWYLFNPSGLPGSQWENLGVDGLYTSRSITTNPMVQLQDNPATPANECGSNCGKVFITARDGDINTPTAELYDPRIVGQAAWRSISYNEVSPWPTSRLSNVVQLSDGRVMMVGLAGVANMTRFFDPITEQFSNGPPPPANYANRLVRPAVLPSGEILFTRNTTSIIYTPQPGGLGSWRPVTNNLCSSPRCHIFSSLPDGRVLGYSSTNSSRGFPLENNGKVWVFDPAATTWAATSDLLNPRAMEGALLDPRTGPCGVHCNKMLVAGYDEPGNPNTGALYTP